MVLPTTKGDTVTTLTDDLHLVLSWAQTTFPNTPSEAVVDAGQVYINYAFATAVCIGVEYQETGKVWYAVATAWDRTGGVADETDIASGNLPHVLREVAKFLMAEAVAEEKLERLLESRPED